MEEYVSHSPEETASIARAFGDNLQSGDIVLLRGDLGAGKTCFTGGLAQAFGINPLVVSSPTFAVMNRYEGKLPVFHFDLYRIKTAREARDTGLADIAGNEGITIIEWPEVAASLLYPPFYEVFLEHTLQNTRTIRIDKKPSHPIG